MASIARLASSSTRSLPGSPAWPLTHCQVRVCGAAAWSSCSHRSWFLTGFLSAVRQPRAFQDGSHSVMPLITYCESVCTVTRVGRFKAARPMMAAVSSMRLLVVAASDPDSSLCVPFQLSSTPQPPGPGLPRQAPSV